MTWSKTCLLATTNFHLTVLSRSQHEDEIEAYYKSRFGDSSTADRFGEGEEMSDEITQQGRLPGVKWVGPLVVVFG